MKYVLAAVSGLVVGIALALAVLYFNPLTREPARAENDDNWVLSYSFPGDSLALTHNGQMHLPRVPASIAPLWETAIQSLALNVLSLKDDEGRVTAVATRFSMPSASTDLLLHGAILTNYWLITVPGEGSFFVHSENNVWRFIKEVYVPIVYFGQTRTGSSTYDLSIGPSPDQTATVYGASGRFAALRGTATEFYELQTFSKHAGIEELNSELRLRFAEPSD